VKDNRSIFVAMILAITSPAIVSSGWAGSTETISVNSTGGQGNSHSEQPSISADGRFVAFISRATNLVDLNGDGVIDPDANGGIRDVFVYDRQTKKTEIVSVNSTGVQGNNSSLNPSISADGRFVAFESEATNLVDINGDGLIDPDANGGALDVFVHDRQTKKTEIVSVNSAAGQGNSHSNNPSISADGRFVAFDSGARNLVDINGDGVIDFDANNFAFDVFVYDRQTKKTEIVSVNNAGVQGTNSSLNPSISADGRFVAFESQATNLMDLNGDGVIDFDANGFATDVFVYDRQTKKIEVVSVSSTGFQGNNASLNPSISADGRFVAFESQASNLVDINGDGVIDPDANGVAGDVFVYDRQTKKSEIVSVNSIGVQGNSRSLNPSISADGRFVAFESGATNLVDINDDDVIDFDVTVSVGDVFVYERQSKKTAIVAVNSTGAQASAGSLNPSISADGQFVAFDSVATNLVDINGDGIIDLDANLAITDVFVVIRHFDDEGPSISNLIVNPNPVSVNTLVQISAWVDDTTTGGSKISSAIAFTEDGVLADTLMNATDSAFDSAMENVQLNLLFPDTEVRQLCVNGTDSEGNTGPAECTLLVVYDPSAGFVTGGGWINSPAGAYRPDTSLFGKASFGFVSKYKRGMTVPTGNTEFQFHSGDMNFSASQYDWLIVAGSKAQFKGAGTINGSGNYGFLLFAIDGRITGGSIDRFRIKIWDKNNADTVVYDNELSAPDDVDPTTAIVGGSIMIHTGDQK
jgi:hypothetical protein